MSSQELIQRDEQSPNPTASTNSVVSLLNTSLIAEGVANSSASMLANSTTTPQATGKRSAARSNSITKKARFEVGGQKKTAADVNQKEVDRIQGLALALEEQLKNPRLRTKVAVKDCKPATFQRAISEDHIQKLIQAHLDFKILLHRQVIIIMPNLDTNIRAKYLILDGQHRWAALKKLANNKSQTSSINSASGSHVPLENVNELAYIEAILFGRDLTLEQQRILANLADRISQLSLPFSDVDLVCEAVNLRSTNSFFAGLKFSRRSAADNLKFFRAYNARFKEYHLLVAGIDDEEQRRPLVELMQAITGGLFRKKDGKGASMTNNLTAWRQIARVFDPALESNAKIVRESLTGNCTHLIGNSVIGDFNALIEKLESEGSHLRQWLDSHGRKEIKVRDFRRKIGAEAVPFDKIYKFFNSSGFDKSTDHDLVASVRTFFSSSIRKNVHNLMLFLEKPFGTHFDFIYVDLRFFQLAIKKIASWLELTTCTFLFVRDYCKEASIAGTQFYPSNPLATAFVLNFDLPIGHALRNSHLHVFSEQDVKSGMEEIDFIHFEELFTGPLKDKMGLSFIGSVDGKEFFSYYSVIKFHF